VSGERKGGEERREREESIYIYVCEIGKVIRG
jgi:hypothetical protein